MKTFFYVIIVFLVSCALGKQGVFYNEMQVEPQISINKNVLKVDVSNSAKNSALVIYKINIDVNQDKKEIYITAYQAINKKIINIFEFDLSKYKINNYNDYSFYWVNPDKKTTQINLSN